MTGCPLGHIITAVQNAGLLVLTGLIKDKNVGQLLTGTHIFLTRLVFEIGELVTASQRAHDVK